jgi:hypothetical protein
MAPPRQKKENEPWKAAGGRHDKQTFCVCVLSHNCHARFVERTIEPEA